VGVFSVKRLFVFLISCLFVSGLTGCYEKDRNKYMKEFSVGTKFYGVRPFFPLSEDRFIGDVYLSSPYRFGDQNYQTLTCPHLGSSF